MQEPTSDTIGARIKQLRLRRAPTMTQRELAERAGVSVDLISKLEQGSKRSCRLTSLHKIAAALDVDVAALLPRPARVDTGNGDGDGGAGQQRAGLERGVVAIRRALTAVWDDGEPAAVADLQREARYAWMLFHTGRFGALGGILPALISAARAGTEQAPHPERWAVLADGYHVTASTLTLLGYIDLAHLALERAIAAAERADEPLYRASLVGWQSWLLVHQTGSADQARRLAVAEADRVEPRRHATPAHRAVWGHLLVHGAVAAARAGARDEADALLDVAETVAQRIGPAGDLGRDSARPFCLPLVVMQRVDVALVTGRPGRALEAAKRMPPDAVADLRPIGMARHLGDVAYAQTLLGRYHAAVETLLSIERVAPDWLRYQPYPRTIVQELRERRARVPGLSGLAQRLGVA